MIEIIYSIACFQGLVVGLLLLKYSEENKTAKSILAAFSFLISLSIFIKLMATIEFISLTMLTLADALLFAFGPILYSFIRYLLTNPSEVHINIWKHSLLPAIYYIGVLFLLFNGISYGNQSMTVIQEQLLSQFFFYSEAVLVISITFYYIITVNYIVSYQKEEKHEFSFKQLPYFFYFIIIFIGFAIMSWASGFIFKLLDLQQLIFLGYNTIWISLALLALSLSYSFIFNNEVVAIVYEKEDILDHENLNEVNETLTEALESEQYYLLPKLSKAELAKLIHTNTTILTKVINGLHRKNFFEFINEYRIAEFMKRIEQDEFKHFSHAALAEDVGFNSKATFYSSFKKIYGTTPRQYLLKQVS